MNPAWDNPLIKTAAEAAEPQSPPGDADIIRRALEEELKASSLYERLARDAGEPAASLLRDVSEEEKVHAGEFRSLLERLDPQYAEADAEGAREAAGKVSGTGGKLDKKAMYGFGAPRGGGYGVPLWSALKDYDTGDTLYVKNSEASKIMRILRDSRKYGVRIKEPELTSRSLVPMQLQGVNLHYLPSDTQHPFTGKELREIWKKQRVGGRSLRDLLKEYRDRIKAAKKKERRG